MVTWPGSRKSGYANRRTQNILNKSNLANLKLMISLGNTSKRQSHNIAFDTHCDKDIWCLIILNKIVKTTRWVRHNTAFCPHSVFVCFVWISEHTAIIFLRSIN